MDFVIGFLCLFFFAIFWRISRHFYIDEAKSKTRTLGWIFFLFLALDSLGAAVWVFYPPLFEGTGFGIELVTTIALPFYALVSLAYYFWPHVHHKFVHQRKNKEND